ncbi:hypothetical protein HCN44_006782 [Aphidius gifuensis]|uniref:Uncharacterized protein n=1 Tax=Aphidius gifuensis TaxID=684658 RepID=A0A835CWN9_APHGI|nr:hypothetical protein HCN44_006782 [Aphidius gifuensis]
MSGIVKNSLLLVGATKNITSKTTTWQRSMWHMAKRLDNRNNNLIASSKTQNFVNHGSKRLQHFLADDSKEACKLTIPEYKPKVDDETYENQQLFASVGDNGEIILQTRKRDEIFIVDELRITEEVFKKLKNEIDAKKNTPYAKIINLLTNYWKFTVVFIWFFIKRNFSSFGGYVYEENGKYNEQDLTVTGSIGKPLAINVLPPAFDEVILKSCQFDEESHYDNGYYDIDQTYNSLTHGTYAEKINFTSLQEAKSCSFIIKSLDESFIGRWIIKTRFDGINKSKQKIWGEKDDRVEIIDKNKPREDL